jgi:hypothetical protein
MFGRSGIAIVENSPEESANRLSHQFQINQIENSQRGCQLSLNPVVSP